MLRAFRLDRWPFGVAVPLIVIIGVIASLVDWQSLRRHQLEAIRDLNDADSAYVAGVIQSELHSRILPLRRMAQRWEESGGTPRAAWLADAENHYSDLPGFQAIEWIDTTYHVRWIFPFRGNEQAQDLDLAYEERRRLALERARASRDISITSTIDLVQGGKGFLVYVPIFAEERFGGFILGVFRVEEFLNTILGSGTSGIALSIFDGQTPIYARGEPSEVDGRDDHSLDRAINFPGLSWTLSVQPTAERYANTRTWLPEAMLVVGLLLVALAAVAMHLAQTARRQVGIIQLLRETARAATETQNSEEHFKRCLESICLYMGWPVGHVYELDRKSDVLMPTDIWYLESESRFSVFRDVTQITPFERGIGLPGRVLETGTPAWIEDVTLDSNFPRARLATNIGVRGAFAFPVIIGQDVVAVLEFFTVSAARPDDSLLELMGRIGLQSGQVMERQLAAEENKRLRIENELILNSAGEGVYGLDPRGHTTFANPAAVRMLGYTLDEMLDHPQHSLIHHSRPNGEPNPREDSSIYAAISDGVTRTVSDEVFWRRDGTSFPVEYTSTPIRRDDEITGAVVVFRDITERKEFEARLLELSMQDQLTGLANRRRLDDCLQSEWRHARRYTRPLTVVMIDVDHFKSFNDAYGHPAGDACLQKVAAALRDSTRRPRDVVARFGGEEFAAVLPETDEVGALVVAESMLACVEALGIEHDGAQETDHVTISLGIASMIPDASATPAELISRADAALYRAKQAGRNQIATYERLPDR